MLVPYQYWRVLLLLLILTRVAGSGPISALMTSRMNPWTVVATEAATLNVWDYVGNVYTDAFTELHVAGMRTNMHAHYSANDACYSASSEYLGKMCYSTNAAQLTANAPFTDHVLHT